MSELRIAVDGPFSLAAAASFGFGPGTGRPYPTDGMMRLAFVSDDLSQHVGVVIRQDPDSSLVADLAGPAGPADEAAVARQLRRILSIEGPAAGWVAAGRADPVLGGVQAAYPGLRPVLFHSPYEAAAWAMLTQRRHRTQAAGLRARLAAAAGHSFLLAGLPEHAFPLPERLLGLDSFPGLDPVRMQRLHGVARAALAGQLEPSRLTAMPAEAAMADLLTLPGLGPVYAGLVYLRATGVTDALIGGEPRLPFYLQHYYGLPEPPDGRAIERIAERWRPFRTWAGVLFRVAGDRDGLPFEPPRRGRPQAGSAKQQAAAGG